MSCAAEELLDTLWSQYTIRTHSAVYSICFCVLCGRRARLCVWIALPIYTFY